MISKLVEGEKTRTAGITTLGKCIELCFHQMSSKSDRETLNNLFKRIKELNENDLYNFDIKYINIHLSK
jgi:hypothetical protein